jgi:hypothetical protein
MEMAMKLAEIDIDELVSALRTERTGWINVASQERRKHTEAECVTMCILAALEHALARVSSTSASTN